MASSKQQLFSQRLKDSPYAFSSTQPFIWSQNCPGAITVNCCACKYAERERENLKKRERGGERERATLSINALGPKEA
jgi:hypothetical protein